MMEPDELRAYVTSAVEKLEALQTEAPPGLLTSYSWLLEDLAGVLIQAPETVSKPELVALLGPWLNRLDERARQSLLRP
jgi:hypothetical protein